MMSIASHSGGYVSNSRAISPLLKSEAVDRLVREVNDTLIEVHSRRMAELGLDGSGLFEHYARLIDQGAILRTIDLQALKIVGERLPKFGEYAVLRAGLGELAFVLGGLGLNVVACEPNMLRFGALSAGLDHFKASKIVNREFVRTENDFVPAAAGSSPTLGIAIDFAFDRQLEDDENFLRGLEQFDALLFDPRLFIWIRTSESAQRDALSLLQSLGFAEIVEFPEAQLVLASRQPVAIGRPIRVVPADRSEMEASDVVVLKKPFDSRGGFSWSAEIPIYLRGDALKRRIPFQLFENETPVKANSNANHIDIKTLGEGRHAFWTDLFCFSASDNSDPNSNGRSYELRKVSQTMLGLWPLGGCTIYNPVYELEKSGQVFVSPKHMGYNGSPYTHTIGEHLQLIDYVRGEFYIPKELRPYCNLEFALKPGGYAAILRDLDAVLVEACSDIEVMFRGVVLNRLRLVDAVIHPFENVARSGGDKNVANIARKWYFDGLIKASPKREEYAAQLLPHVPREGEASELLRAIIREAAPRRIGMDTFVEGVRHIGALVGKPLGVLTHTQYYMPDGRPISWPPALHNDIMKTCSANGIPFMHPCALVEQHGAGVALKKDLIHWHDDFMPVIGEAMAEFAHRVIAGYP
jgi:hypothetical protein